MIRFLGFLVLIGLFSGCKGQKSYNLVELTKKIETSSTNEKFEFEDVEVYNLGNLRPLAEYSLNKNAIKFKPLKVKDILYFMDQENVYAFSLTSKEIIWNNNLNKKGINNSSGGGITYHKGKLYIANGSRYLIVLDACKGYELYRKEFSNSIKTKPVILNDNEILVQNISNQLEIFDLKTTNIVSFGDSYQPNIKSSYYMEPMFYKDTVIFSYSSGVIFAIDCKTKQNVWLVNMADLIKDSKLFYESIDINCKPVVIAGDLYVANSLNQLLKIDLGSGKVIWNVELSDIQAMNQIGNSLFVVTNSSQIAAISLSNGKVKWVSYLESEKSDTSGTLFLKPVLTYDDVECKKYLTVFGDKGKSYNFLVEDNSLSSNSIIKKIPKKIKFISEEDNKKPYLITDNKIFFNH